MENQIVIRSPDATFRAYISRPAKLAAPAVVVLQELFGVNADIRATCDALAAQGFDALSGTPEDFAAFYRSEVDKWRKVIVATGMSL